MTKHDRGWAGLDTGWALLVLILLVTFAAGKYRDYLQEKNWQVESTRTSTYASAARAYIGRNYTALLSASTTTSPTVITTTMLKNTGFLPVGFTETNSQGQIMQTWVVRNGQNTELLQGMVASTGGSAYPLKALIMMAKNITTGFGGYIDDGQTITGALRSWRIPLSAYGATSGNGHVAVLLSTDELSAAQEDNDRLYRFQVNGRPDLNKMHTSIDMGINNLNNVATLNGQNGIFSSEVRGEYGNFSANITAGGQVKGATVQADSDIAAGRNITANNQVTGSTVRANGNLSAGGVLQLDQINVAGTACYPNGLVSRDASGAVLSCQSGAWQGATGGAYNLGRNGYKILDTDTGLMMQWGFTSTNGDNASTCFTVPFKTTVLNVSVESMGRQIHGDNGHDYIGSVTNSCFTFTSEPGSSGTSWFAIGY